MCNPTRRSLSISRPDSGSHDGDMRPYTQMQVGFAPRLAAFYAGLFITGGIQLPFFPVWLKAKGLDPQMIGLVLAAPIVARMIAVPLVARAADRREALRAAIIGASFLGVAGFVLVGLAEGAWAILIAYALDALALTPVMPLAETYALKGPGRARTRLWAGAAVGLGRLYPRHLRGRLCHRYASRAPSDLADRRREPAQRDCRAGAGAAVGHRAAAKRAGQAAPTFAARSRLHRRAGGGQPYPGQPRGLLRLLGAGMARRRPRRYGDRRAVGARRHRGNRAVRGLGTAAAVLSAERAADDRGGRRRATLGGYGARSAGARFAVAATAACGLVRRHPSRRARLCRATCAGRAKRDRARLSGDRDRRAIGGGDGLIGMALRRLL